MRWKRRRRLKLQRRTLDRFERTRPLTRKLVALGLLDPIVAELHYYAAAQRHRA
jgi:hypothetical protein